ncbi:hypothetical protein AVEN_200234-1 [Araneus ventricosus]|uniref:Uncharacterized protein n=1 Tax=Araneus ventricosus TaxID=182803 RepID=A0A4Y2Q0H2_ARAVE|nr:hypothetical protein AVEN_7454-1 [Araneus ventricosus]GBN57046.1 hypothetical protein AVEN_200234-1 [Araneus ventricosus]
MHIFRSIFVLRPPVDTDLKNGFYPKNPNMFKETEIRQAPWKIYASHILSFQQFIHESYVAYSPPICQVSYRQLYSDVTRSYCPQKMENWSNGKWRRILAGSCYGW